MAGHLIPHGAQADDAGVPHTILIHQAFLYPYRPSGWGWSFTAAKPHFWYHKQVGRAAENPSEYFGKCPFQRACGPGPLDYERITLICEQGAAAQNIDGTFLCR
jgi:hypothetical protein